MSKPSKHVRISFQALLTQLAADPGNTRPRRIAVRIAGVDGEKTYTLDPERGELSGPADNGPAVLGSGSSAGLTPMQADILDALQNAGEELNTKKLAARAGYKPHAYFRKALRKLLARYLIERGRDGYRLPP